MSEPKAFVAAELGQFSHTIDGEAVVFELIGNTEREWVEMPAKLVPRFVALILSAASNANRAKKGETIHQALAARKISTFEVPGSSDSALAIEIQSGAAPLIFRLSTEALVQVALGILETQGLVATERTGKPQ